MESGYKTHTLLASWFKHRYFRGGSLWHLANIADGPYIWIKMRPLGQLLFQCSVKPALARQMGSARSNSLFISSLLLQFRYGFNAGGWFKLANPSWSTSGDQNFSAVIYCQSALWQSPGLSPMDSNRKNQILGQNSFWGWLASGTDVTGRMWLQGR